MSSPADRVSIDYERLSGFLKVLAVENRLRLLHKLQVPHTAAEVDLKPARASRTLNEDRPLTRQAVSDHIKVLEEIGMVEARPRAEATEYVVNHPRLFEVVEELKRLSLIRPVGPAAPEETTLASAGVGVRPSAVPAGPAIVLVSGPLEGTAFALAGAGPWTIGRGEDNHVALPYDPFVSGRNAAVEKRLLRWELAAAPGARNGTWLNWARIPDGETVAVKPGDTIGVGRSLLVFRA